jgi:hypothetical protein
VDDHAKLTPDGQQIQIEAFIVCHRCKRSLPLNSDWRGIAIEDERGFTMWTQVCPDCVRRPRITNEQWALLGTLVGCLAGLAGWWFGR